MVFDNDDMIPRILRLSSSIYIIISMVLSSKLSLKFQFLPDKNIPTKNYNDIYYVYCFLNRKIFTASMEFKRETHYESKRILRDTTYRREIERYPTALHDK